MHPFDGSKVLVMIALGTAGDVVPLFNLGQLILSQRPRARIALITHAELIPLLQSMNNRLFIELRTLNSSSLRRPVQDSDRVDSDVIASDADAAESVDSDQRLNRDQRFQEMNEILAHCLDAIVANPYFIPYSAPAHFERALKADYGRTGVPLIEHLKSIDQSSSQIGWNDVSHWMWSAMLNREHRTFRDQYLHLHPNILQAEWQCYGQLPPAPPLLYGLSPYLFPLPAGTPGSALCSGFWQPMSCDRELIAHSNVELSQFIKSSLPIEVYVGFGSMGAIGLLSRPHVILQCILDALKRLQLRAVVARSSFCRLNSTEVSSAEASRLLDAAAADGLVFSIEKSVPHQWLFPQCVLIISHGGSGTVASALSAGCPQVCVPFLFDQFYFAEQIEYGGLGAQCRVAALICPQTGSAEIQKCIQRALSTSCRNENLAVKRHLEVESADIVGKVCSAITRACSDYSAFIDAVKLKSDSEFLCPRLQPRGVRVPWNFNFNYYVNESQCSNKRRLIEKSQSVLCVSSETEMNFLVDELFVQRVYNCEPISVSALRQGDLILDIGSNVGLFNLFLDSEVDGGLKAAGLTVISFEPVQQNFECLVKNLENWNLAPSNDSIQCVQSSFLDCISIPELQCGVYPLRIGVAAKASPAAEFTFYPSMAGNSTLSELQEEKILETKLVMSTQSASALLANPTKCVAPVMTLNQILTALEPKLCGDASIGLLKVDVEGAELLALQTVSVQQWLLIRQVVVEVHRVGDRVDQVFELLYQHAGFDQIRMQESDQNRAVLLYAARTE